MPIYQASLLFQGLNGRLWLVLELAVFVFDRLIHDSIATVSRANSPQHDNAICHGIIVIIGTTTKAQKPANTDIDRLNTPVARAI